MTFPNSLAGLKQGLEALKTWLTAANVGQQAEDRAFLVFEEIVTNIIRYGFDDAKEHKIDVSFARNDGELTLIFEDGGRAIRPARGAESRSPPPAGATRRSAAGAFISSAKPRNGSIMNAPRGAETA